MEIYDISLPITPEMVVWPGDPKVVLERVESMDSGAHANVSRLGCSVHTGTHVDAPHHFLNDGRTVETLSLKVLVGRVLVLQIDETVDLVTAPILEGFSIPSGTIRLLLKTRNSEIWKHGEDHFRGDFVAISADGAEWLVAHGIQLIGIDYLSVAPYQDSSPTHHILLEAGVVILEGVDLSCVVPGEYDLYCLPLKLAGSDGAPARAILVNKRNIPQG
jgi:arylformamidase